MKSSSFACRRDRRRAFTLIEMLVALAITLIMMGAVVTLFGVVGESVGHSRTAIEMSDRLRSARNTIQSDLLGVTATMKPPLRPENGEGYFEIIEGPNFDGSFSAAFSIFGDTDDKLMFTTRQTIPFVGWFNGSRVESAVAEVAYFLVLDGPIVNATTTPVTRLGTLHRRVLLVMPSMPSLTTQPQNWLVTNDISVRYETPGGTPTLIANTLGDLTKRENRFSHYNTNTTYNPAFPFFAVVAPINSMNSPPTLQTSMNLSWPTNRPLLYAFIGPSLDAAGNQYNPNLDTNGNPIRLGDDVLLTNVLAFDVQVWDPGAPIFIETNSNTPLEPSDPGWANAATTWANPSNNYTYTAPPAAPTNTTQPMAFGAYVDLGYGGTTYAPPAGRPQPLFANINGNAYPTGNFATAVTGTRVYDTWSTHYESNGLNEPAGVAATATSGDLGMNGLDDGGIAGVVDDQGEYDTLPPYAAPLRGIRIRLRVYEPNSKQVREAVIVQDFRTD